MANWYYVVGDQSFNYLTADQMEYNANILTRVLRADGWTDYAIAGALGNIQAEGILNPGQCEVGEGVPYGVTDSNYAGGLGLIQWTKPSGGSINPLLRYAQENGKNWYDGDLQAQYITKADDYNYTYGYWGWIASATYDISFSQYKQSTNSPSYCAKAWLYNLERPGNPSASENTRAQNAETWYQWIQDSAYVPLLDMDGIYSSPYYTTWNQYYVSGVGMPNCTAFVYGRWNQLCDYRELHNRFPIHQGCDWYPDGIALGFQGGMTPQLGAVACWWYEGWDEDEQAYIPTGHVAVVEQINYDSNGNPVSFVTSNSAWFRGTDWNNPRNEYPWFYLNTISMSNLDDPWGTHPEGYFQGFLYNSNISPNPPHPTPTRTKMPFIFYLKRRI